jgi:hypothetical protein
MYCFGVLKQPIKVALECSTVGGPFFWPHAQHGGQKIQKNIF